MGPDETWQPAATRHQRHSRATDVRSDTRASRSPRSTVEGRAASACVFSTLEPRAREDRVVCGEKAVRAAGSHAAVASCVAARRGGGGGGRAQLQIWWSIRTARRRAGKHIWSVSSNCRGNDGRCRAMPPWRAFEDATTDGNVIICTSRCLCAWRGRRRRMGRRYTVVRFDARISLDRSRLCSGQCSFRREVGPPRDGGRSRFGTEGARRTTTHGTYCLMRLLYLSVP